MYIYIYIYMLRSMSFIIVCTQHLYTMIYDTTLYYTIL